MSTRTICSGVLLLALCIGCFAHVGARPDHAQPPSVSNHANTPATEFVDSSYVVLLDHDADESTYATMGAAGATVLRTDGRLINVQLPPSASSEAVSALGKTKGVRAIEPNIAIHAVVEPWHRDRVDQCVLPLNGVYTAPSSTPGQGVSVYVVDTGVDKQHPLFGGRVADFYTAYASYSDENGHGTHVSGIAGAEQYGIAYATSIKNVRVLDASGSGSLLNLAAGLLAIQASGTTPGVINLSLGYYGTSILIGSIIGDLLDAGFVVVAAAGNDNTDACSHQPSAVSGVLSIGASSSSDTIASFSNYGACVDSYAPGVGVTSLKLGGGTIAYSGTSMATPVVSGIAATVLQQHPSWTPAQVADFLIANSAHNVIIGAGSNGNRLFTVLMSDQCAWTASSSTSVATSTSSSSSSSTTSSTSSAVPIQSVGVCLLALFALMNC